MIGIAVLGGVIAALTSADCRDCHPRQAAALDGARHVRAAELAIFRAPLARAATRWCLGCHRPEGRPTAGLDCLSCHRVPGDATAVLAALPASAGARSAHEVVVEPGLARDACARCHDFATPLPGHLDPVVYSAQPLQATARELRAAFPDARCQACHDPHRPRGAHDPDTLRSAVAFSVRTDDGGVAIEVKARGVGHRFPTGDPFRRLVVSVCDDAACVSPTARQTIGRGFGLVGGVWAPITDSTLADGETRVLRFPPAAYWRAEFRYGDPAFEAQLPPDEVSIVLAGGPL